MLLRRFNRQNLSSLNTSSVFTFSTTANNIDVIFIQHTPFAILLQESIFISTLEVV